MAQTQQPVAVHFLLFLPRELRARHIGLKSTCTAGGSSVSYGR